MGEEVKGLIHEEKNTIAFSAINTIEKYGTGYDFYLGYVKPVVEDCALAIPESRDKLLVNVSDRLRGSGKNWRLQAMLIDLLLDVNEVGWRGFSENETDKEHAGEFKKIIKRFLLPGVYPVY